MLCFHRKPPTERSCWAEGAQRRALSLSEVKGRVNRTVVGIGFVELHTLLVAYVAVYF